MSYAAHRKLMLDAYRAEIGDEDFASRKTLLEEQLDMMEREGALLDDETLARWQAENRAVPTT